MARASPNLESLDWKKDPLGTIAGLMLGVVLVVGFLVGAAVCILLPPYLFGRYAPYQNGMQPPIAPTFSDYWFRGLVGIAFVGIVFAVLAGIVAQIFFPTSGTKAAGGGMSDRGSEVAESKPKEDDWWGRMQEDKRYQEAREADRQRTKIIDDNANKG